VFEDAAAYKDRLIGGERISEFESAGGSAIVVRV
jgi:hypothetical protein